MSLSRPFNPVERILLALSLSLSLWVKFAKRTDGFVKHKTVQIAIASRSEIPTSLFASLWCHRHPPHSIPMSLVRGSSTASSRDRRKTAECLWMSEPEIFLVLNSCYIDTKRFPLEKLREKDTLNFTSIYSEICSHVP